MNDLVDAIKTRRVLVCVGSGGVGKTTVSASLGLQAAAMGRSSLVCTIDPARRLANALGLTELGNTETRIDDSPLAQAGIDLRAPMFAMMLDMKRSWDDLIARYAPPEKRETILHNRFYQALSTALAGSQEYIAMEKLWQLRHERGQDLIVLDTPPTAHALDFLEAPNRLLDFLDHDVAKRLMVPALTAGKLGLKLMNLGGNFLARTLSRLTGAETLQELANFLLSMEGLNEGFRHRARQTRELLASPQTGFVLVTSAARERLDEAEHFFRLLHEHGMQVLAIVVNRVHLPVSSAALAEARTLPEPLRERALTTLSEFDCLADHDARGAAEIRKWRASTPLVEIPRFPLDVHDLQSLWHTGRYVTGELKVPRTM